MFNPAQRHNVSYRCSGRKAVLVVAVISGLMAGCTTKPSADGPPRIGNGAQQYRKLSTEASKSVQQALDWLDRVGAQTNRCPPTLVGGFSDEVERMQVDSLRIRARSRAILARGDAYFDAWATNGIAPDSPQARKAAEYLPQLKDSFGKIKLTGHQTGGAFTNFFSGLRKIRVQLQKNPGATEATETHELIRTTRASGEQVVQHLGDLRDELDKVIPVLERAKAEKL